MERQQDYVLRTVEERGIRFVLLWFTDVLGQLKSVAIPPTELETAFEEGMSFDGSAIRSIAAIRPSVTVKPTTANGRSPSMITAPAAPLTTAGRANGANRVPRDRI